MVRRRLAPEQENREKDNVSESNALLERIVAEEAAKQQQCACIGCTNRATHTWSGHPTCDECGTPGRTKLALPVLHGNKP